MVQEDHTQSVQVSECVLPQNVLWMHSIVRLFDFTMQLSVLI